MADILISGALEHFPESTAVFLAENSRIVLAGKHAPEKIKERRITSYRTEPEDKQFQQLFDVYSFQTVFFISGFADGGSGGEELGQLERLLDMCVAARIDKMIVLSTVESLNYVLEETGDRLIQKEYLSGKALLSGQMEELCRYYSKKEGIKIITLHLPYLADWNWSGTGFLCDVFSKIKNKEPLNFNAGREDRIDFISSKDLARLLQCIVEEQEDADGAFFVCSGFQNTYETFAKELGKLAEITVQYSSESGGIPWQNYPYELRRVYGFIPMDHVVEDIPRYYQDYIEKTKEKKPTVMERLRNLFMSQVGFFRYVELIVVFFLVEIMNSYMSVSVYFKFVDIRLLFIVMMATIYGMRLGICAAALECLALVWQYGKMGVDWALLFYNIENWIPFAAYLMAGSVSGYIKNKSTDELRFMKEEHRLLYDKYMFLNNAYYGALENKKEYKKQIIGFKDSFGKIFDAVQRLDSMVPQKIYFEGLKVMEDILENRTIAIYSLDRWQRFGRLAVCSSSMSKSLAKSLNLEEHQRLYETVRSGQVWKNTDLLPDEPMYADGVIQNGQLALLIVVYHAGQEQYSVRYMNIFHILCGLVQTAFLRARDYEQLLEERIYYPETTVVYPERFLEIVRAQEEMKRSGVADFVLLKLKERDRKNASESMSGVIRSTDMLGADEDGNIYVLLAQAGMDTFHFVGDRLQQRGIAYEIVKKVG